MLVPGVTKSNPLLHRSEDNCELPEEGEVACGRERFAAVLC